MRAPDEHPTFLQARAELSALGFVLTEAESPGTSPYTVVGGRSNARWWLFPLESGGLFRSGLALFQPVSRSARLLKNAAGLASHLGLGSLAFRATVHVAVGPGPVQAAFPGVALRYAFFTGTDTPHRKIAVQVMGEDGAVLGYLKAGRSAGARTLLDAEAARLREVAALQLAKAETPRVLAQGRAGEVGYLLTDGFKTRAARTALTLEPAHLAFLVELRERSVEPGTAGSDWLLPRWRSTLDGISSHLTLEWRNRLQRAFASVARLGVLPDRHLAHGDFTPWNCYLERAKLHVFDWEYASRNAPPAYDLAHFALAAQRGRNASAILRGAVGVIERYLAPVAPDLDPSASGAVLTACLCETALRYAERSPVDATCFSGWSEEALAARLLDMVTT